MARAIDVTTQFKDATSSATRAPGMDSANSQIRMPATVRRILFAIVTLLVAGGFYLLAVRGDALLADLAAIAALICG